MRGKQSGPGKAEPAGEYEVDLLEETGGQWERPKEFSWRQGAQLRQALWERGSSHRPGHAGQLGTGGDRGITYGASVLSFDSRGVFGVFCTFNRTQSRSGQRHLMELLGPGVSNLVERWKMNEDSEEGILAVINRRKVHRESRRKSLYQYPENSRQMLEGLEERPRIKLMGIKSLFKEFKSHQKKEKKERKIKMQGHPN